MMLDLKFIRANPEEVRRAMQAKGEEKADLDQLLRWDAAWRDHLQELEQLRAERNAVSKRVGEIKRAGGDGAELIERMRQVNQRIGELEGTVRSLEESINQALLLIPNIPHASVPVGRDESDNQELRRWGQPRRFNFEPQAHWDLGTALNVLDFERASKIAGSRFTVFCGVGARLVRALIGFMLDCHLEEGYREVYPPFLVSRASMTGTGQLPKFEDDAFLIEKFDYFLVPTAEVPVTNLYRDEILDVEDLPVKHVAYTPCFRAEAGAAGRDSRGLIRQHQFDKVEMVQYTLPENSCRALEDMTGQAESVLQALDLPYRLMVMCTGDMGFGQVKQYDLEVWMPSYDRYVEISSISNFGDFQARRANLRFRRQSGGRPEFVHTLNGSGLAVGRTIAALLENYQEADGSVVLPERLRPYMKGLERITAASN